jgi:hypothetical protein
LFFPNLKVWHMLNQDTFETLSGQFEAEELSEERGSVYSERFTLNRKKAILQFLHGVTPTVSFRGMFFNETILGPLVCGVPVGLDVSKNLQTLKDWSERDDILMRPPVVTFWVGSGFLTLDCVIESVSPVYHKPNALGSFRGADFTVTLREFTAFDPTATAAFDTRYARVKTGDYYELLAAREYRQPLLGVFLRQRNPDKPNLQVGNILKLPSAGGPTLRQARIEPASIPMKDAFGGKPTPTKLRRERMLKLRNKSKTSYTIYTNI